MSARPAAVFPGHDHPLLFQIFQYFFFLSLFVFPFFFGAVNLWAFSMGAVLLCGAFSAYWFSHRHGTGGVLRTPLDGWIAVYVVFFLLSMVFSRIPYVSRLELFKLTVVLCAFLATRYLCRERAQIYRLAECFVFLGGLLSVIGLLQFVGGLPNGWWSRSYMLSSMYVNHNHFAGVLVLILPISFGLILAERSKPKQILFIFFSVLMSVAFVFALSRGALVALGLATAWMLWVLKKRDLLSPSLLPLALFVALVVGAVIVFGTDTIERRIENIRMMTEEEELSMRFRWLTWKGTLPMIRDFFWFGSGPGTFAQLFLKFRPAGDFSVRPVHAHNDILQLWAECGVGAFLAVVGLLVAFFRQGLRVLWHDESHLRIGVGSGVMAGILGLVIHSFFDFNFHIPANWLLATVAAGLLFSMDKDEFYHFKPVSMALKVVISLALLAVPVFSYYFGISDYHLWEAKQLLKGGGPKEALEAVEKGLRLSPSDPEAYYLRAFVRLSGDGTDREHTPGAVGPAVKDLDEAIRLDPYEPVYDLAKAHALFPVMAEASPLELTRLYENAIVKDPNNPGLGSLVAKDVFLHNAPQYTALRESVGQMLSQRRESLAGLVAFLEKRDLWRYHRRYHLKLAGVDPDSVDHMAPHEPWTKDPANVLALDDFTFAGSGPPPQGDIVYSSGKLTKKINIHNPMVRIVLSASGSAVRGIYPAVYVTMDGKLADEYYVDSTVFKNYFTDLTVMPGPHLLSLEYANDIQVGPLSSQDRNLRIRQVSVLESL